MTRRPLARTTAALPAFLAQPRPAASAPQISANDPTLQRAPGAVHGLTPGQNFLGLDFNAWGSGWPPDPNGDVGPDHYLEAVNISLAIFNKTGTRLAAFTYDDLMANAAFPCNLYNQGDPIVLYDAISGRWIASDFAWTDIDNGPYYECIAVSKTADPVSGGWWLYAFQIDRNWMGDYPKLAIWSDGIYLTANMYDIFGNGCCGTPTGARVWALNRSDLINGLAFRYISFSLSDNLNTVLPSNLRGALPPSGTPAFFASVYEPNLLHLWRFHVDWNTPGNSTFTGPTDLSLPVFVMPCYAAYYLSCVPQLNGEYVDGLGDRLMMQLQYRNLNGVESLWLNHSIAADSGLGQAIGVRWYEIRNPNGAPELHQAGTYQPDATFRWIASLAVDKAGNMAIGYSASSASMYPAIRYTGRLASDPLNVLQTEATLIQGTGSQSGGYARWGDYSTMTVDPADDCTFWYINEYYATTGHNWQTRIGSFKFPECVPLPQIQKLFLPLQLR